MTRHIEQTVNQLQQLLEQLKTATQEAHGVLRDIRDERAATQTWLDTIVPQWRKDTDKQVTEAVKDSVDKLGASTRRAMDAATNKVFREFDKLHALLTGEREADSMDKIAARVGAAVDHLRYDPHRHAIPPALRRAKTVQDVVDGLPPGTEVT